ncbi:hypothetical protein Anas_05570, partial [Armadillidium nasatum]
PTTSSINVIDSISNKDYQSFNKSRRNHNLTEDSTVTNAPKISSYNDSGFQSSTDDEGLFQESISERTTSSINFTKKINISTLSSTSPDISMGGVKINPVEKKDNTVLICGIALSCIASIVVVSCLIYFCYQKRKKLTSHQIEMMSMRFDDV